MKISNLFGKTYYETSEKITSPNHQLLVKGGFVDQLIAGVYTYLPLGFKVLKNIGNIVREEMDNIGGQEIFMPVLQPKNLWQETNRWDPPGIAEILYKLKDQRGSELALGPTHEEVLTDIVRKQIHSYKNLPLYIYQIQTKFRDEPRAKSGLLRGREFLMKDLYSFHTNEEDRKRYYEIVKKAYFKIFKRCGLKTVLTEASGGAFSKEISHEFQVITPAGEDTIIVCPKGDFGQNMEITSKKEGDKCPHCSKQLKIARAIEVGNIFTLGTKYSEAMKAFFIDRNDQQQPIIMGCYGLGISRLLGSIVEVSHDSKGIIWPTAVAPYDIYLISLPDTNKEAENLYRALQTQGLKVLYDDRLESVGVKFVDCDLIGLPLRIVISQKTLTKKSVEFKQRSKEETKLVPLKNLSSFLKDLINKT